MGHHQAKQIGAEQMKELAFLLREATDAGDVKRLQCVYFRGKGLAKEVIAELVQYNHGHVQRIWTQYFKSGAQSLITKPRGGRKHENMSREAEAELLATHAESAKQGKLLKIAPLHLALCKKLGKDVAVSSAYRLAHRHGWRKIEPRPRHPGRNAKSAEYFKLFFPDTP